MITSLLRRIALAAALSALPSAALAQAGGKVARIGVVLSASAEGIARRSVPVQGPLEEGLREQGWVEGKNLQILYRHLDAIDELVRLPVDVLVVFQNVEPAMRATTTIPIVSGAAPAARLSASNVTGISSERLQGELATKRLSLLKEAAGVKRVARFYFGEPLRFGSVDELLPEYRAAARALDLEVFPVWARTPEELRMAFAELARKPRLGISLATVRRLPGMESIWDAYVSEAARHRFPSIADTPDAVADGAMMGYGDTMPDRARRLSYFIDRILKGAKPSELPVEQPSRFRLAVNVQAAESIGVKIPQSILLQADRVIR